MGKPSLLAGGWAVLLPAILLFGCGTAKDASSSGKTKVIRFADVGWDSIRFHNAVLAWIGRGAGGGFRLRLRKGKGGCRILLRAMRFLR